MNSHETPIQDPVAPSVHKGLVERLPPEASKAMRSTSPWKILLALAMGVLLGVLGARLGRTLGSEHFIPYGGPVLMKGLVIAFLPLAWLLCVAVHEFGHLVGGWLTGGRFLLWMVGPVKVQRSPNGIRVGINRSLNLLGGLAACPPVDPALVSARRFVVVVLAGPLASLVLAVCLVGFGRHAAATGLLREGAWPLVQHASLMTGALSGLICISTLIPASVGGLRTDGLRAFVLLRGGPRAAQETAMLSFISLSLAGVRPRDYPERFIQGATVLNDHSLFDRYAHLSAFSWAADRGDWPKAQACLDHFFQPGEAVAPYIEATARCEYAWLLGAHTPWCGTARAWLSSAGKIEFDAGTRCRAEAAVLLAEGRAGEAAGRAREGLRKAEADSLSPNRSLFMEDSLRQLLIRAEAAKDVRAPSP